MDYYETLGISEGADDKEVRQAYLGLVKEHPPERSPERFREISTAYEALKDSKSRMEYYLFSSDPGIESPFEAVTGLFRNQDHRKPLSFKDMKEYFRRCAETK